MGPTEPLTRLLLRSDVSCIDGHLGELADLVIDPEQGRVTHLVIDAMPSSGARRLAPLALAENQAGGSQLVLRCSVKQARQLPSIGEVTEVRFGQAPAADADWDVGSTEVVPAPQYDPGSLVDYHPDPYPDIVMMYDRVPRGTIEIGHDSEIATADGGDAGRAQGVVVAGGQITHLVLTRGHLWRRHELKVPVSSIATWNTDRVVLAITLAEVRNL